MALTGAAMFAFVLAHMVGNLQIFAGADTLNKYADLLQNGSKEFLWAFRIGLLSMVVIHVLAAIRLTALNRSARSIPYLEQKSIKATLASRVMGISGCVVLAFIVFHILHFTVHSVPGTGEMHAVDEKGRHDVYVMMISAFQIWWVVLVYIVGVALLSFHLSHGVTSMFRSLGLSGAKLTPVLDKAAVAFALLVFAGMSVIPAACFLDLIH